MRVLGEDFRGQAGRISIIHRERVGRMVMEDEILISVSHNRMQICSEGVWRLTESEEGNDSSSHQKHGQKRTAHYPLN